MSDNGGFVPPSPEPLADFWEQVTAGMAAEYGRLFDERFDGLLNGDNSSPGPQGILGAKKLTAYMEISDELAFPERYPYVPPVRTRRERFASWRSDRVWSVRRRLAVALLGYDPDDE